jgi:predicted Rossmann fold nucleotide-binding protein DprA/Smf involved in DNA uptake
LFVAPLPQKSFDDSPQGRVMAACQQPASLDDLCQVTGLTMGELNGLLFDLQLEGKVAQNFMGMWHLT